MLGRNIRLKGYVSGFCVRVEEWNVTAMFRFDKFQQEWSVYESVENKLLRTKFVPVGTNLDERRVFS